ncbi:MAG: hypothetical protein K6U74_11795 [Firmicutes bacterium]|nr:hypothetical protein [Bacillota bacterium]
MSFTDTWREFVEGRIDDIGFTISNSDEHQEHFEKYCEVIKILWEKLDPNDRILLGRLEAAIDSLVSLVEVECYLQGLRDWRLLGHILLDGKGESDESNVAQLNGHQLSACGKRRDQANRSLPNE